MYELFIANKDYSSWSMREWYAAALQEPWRHEESEAVVRGILVEDRRVPQTA